MSNGHTSNQLSAIGSGKASRKQNSAKKRKNSETNVRVKALSKDEVKASQLERTLGSRNGSRGSNILKNKLSGSGLNAGGISNSMMTSNGFPKGKCLLCDFFR